MVAIDLRTVPQVSGFIGRIGSFGSVSFRFDGLSPANVFAATIVSREGEPIDFHFDALDNGGPNYHSGGIEGMWWLPSASSTDYVILSNPLKTTVVGNLLLTSASASYRPVALSLGPGETKRVDVGEILGASVAGAAGGLRLSLPGKEPIFATQIVFDEVTGLAAIMKLFERWPDDQSRNHVLRAPMMALSQPDAGLGFPEGTRLFPLVFLRNAASADMQVTAAIDWRNQSSGTFELPTITLAPGDVKVIHLTEYQQAGQVPADANWATLRLGYTGRSADLPAVAVSYDKTNRYGLQTPFSEALSRLWAGGMWHVDANHGTLITTGNAGIEATTAEATLFYNGGKGRYRMTTMLAPGQQMWIDVGRLVREQIPDADGNTLPPRTMTGSYELRDLDHPTVGQLFEGKLVIDKTYGHASYGCGGCCGYVAPYIDPEDFNGPPDDENDDYIYSTDSCIGELVDVTDGGYDWASSDTAVAKLPNRTLTTVAVGSATGSSDIELEWDQPRAKCPNEIFGPQQPITVQKPQITSFDPNPIMIGVSNTTLTINGSGFGTDPTVDLPPGFTSSGQGSTNSQIVFTGVSVALSATVGNSNVTVTAGGQTSAPASLTVDGPYHMIVESDVTGLCSGCETTVQRTVSYQIQNFSGSDAGATHMGESATFGNSSCTPNTLPSPTLCASNFSSLSSGTFSDVWSLNSDSYTPSGCGFTVTDHWQWCAHSPAQTLGTLTGYTHTNALLVNGVLSPSQMVPGTVVPF